MLSWSALAVVLPIVVFVALRMQPYFLLMLDFPMVVLGSADWQLAGVRLDPSDLILMALFAIGVLRRPPDATRARLRPMFRLWVLLGVCYSIAYVSAPVNQGGLTDPVRIAYQVYRYCWRPIMFYPLVLLLVSNDPRRLGGMTGAIMLGGALSALMAIFQGYTGSDAVGPFGGRNELGGALVGPCVLAITSIAVEQKQRRWLLTIAAALVIVRGLVFCGSRGAFVGCAAGVMMFFAFFMLSGAGLMRVLRYGAAAVALLVALLIVNPDILNRPSIQHLLSARGGTTDENMQWRMQQRWPHFIGMIKESPWVGTGTDQDVSLSFTGNTPHNGYLSLAMIHGVPAAALIVLFCISSILRGIQVYSRAGPRVEDRLFCLVAASTIAGVLVHNIVESTLVTPFVQNLIWSLCALIGARAVNARRPSTPAPERPRVRRGPAPRRLRPASAGEAIAPANAGGENP